MNSKYLSTLNLEPFLRNSIGMSRVFANACERVEHANEGNYPPYNIIQFSDTQYEIEMAVAGFQKNDIEITVNSIGYSDGAHLTIRGKVGTILTDPGTDKETSEDIHRKDLHDMASGNTKYLHRGISARNFERQFALAEHVEVVVAGMQDGILTIALARSVPDTVEEKTIEIK